MLHRLPRFTICSLTLCALLSGCSGGAPPAELPILETEPPGAPADVAEGRRFAIANVTPGPVTVEAFGRLTAGAPLTLLSVADVSVTADEITSVDLQPHLSVER